MFPRRAEKRSCTGLLAALRSARRLAGGEFDDLGGDLVLPHQALRRPQFVKLAIDLAPRRRHRLDSRLVLGGEGVERGVAELRMEEIEGEVADERLGGKFISGAAARVDGAKARRSNGNSRRRTT